MHNFTWIAVVCAVNMYISNNYQTNIVRFG